jgi:broad specificity phosphatase PhoE
MHIITLLRHGESAGNANGQIQGKTDLPLTEKGELQAHELAEKWLSSGRKYDWVIASPLLRSRKTAEIIANLLNLSVEYDPDLMERGFGEIEGRVYQELLQEIPAPDFNHPYLQPGGHGESLVDLYNRAGLAIQNLLRRPPGAYLVVSHGAFLNMALYAILGISPHNSPRSPRFIFSNTGYLDLTYNQDIHQWRLYQFSNQDDLAF